VKVKELIEILKTKNPEAVVIIHMDGSLGPELLCNRFTYEKMLVYGDIVEYPEECPDEELVDTIGFEGMD